jgi:hypothetical protein
VVAWLRGDSTGNQSNHGFLESSYLVTLCAETCGLHVERLSLFDFNQNWICQQISAKLSNLRFNENMKIGKICSADFELLHAGILRSK